MTGYCAPGTWGGTPFTAHGEALEELIVTGRETGEWGADQAQAVLREAMKVNHAGDAHVIGRLAVTFDHRAFTFAITGFTPGDADPACASPYAHGQCGARLGETGWYWPPGARDTVGHEHAAGQDGDTEQETAR